MFDIWLLLLLPLPLGPTWLKVQVRSQKGELSCVPGWEVRTLWQGWRVGYTLASWQGRGFRGFTDCDWAWPRCAWGQGAGWAVVVP